MVVCLMVPTWASAAPLRVAVSIYPLAMLVSELGGDQVTVSTLLKPGASPHGFEPSPSQIRMLSRADLFVTVGAGLDPWADRMARAIRRNRNNLPLANVVPLTGADHSDSHRHGGTHDGGDPHFWLDPVLVRDHVIPALAGALAELRPEEAPAFAEASDRMRADLTALHEELGAELAPFAGKAFVAFHGPWGYFARRYRLNQVGVVEPTPGREPSARWMMKVVTTARKAGARAILVEPQFNPRVAYTIAGQFRAKVVEVDPVGRPGTPSGESYAGLMRYNVAAFIKAFSK